MCNASLVLTTAADCFGWKKILVKLKMQWHVLAALLVQTAFLRPKAVEN